MRPRRAKRLPRIWALALVVVLVAGCSSAAEPHQQLFDDAGALASALLEAVATGREAQAGFSDPGTAATSLTSASSASGRLESTAAQIDSITERNLGLEMAIVANQVVALLAAGDVQAAERTRVGSFVPLAAELFAEYEMSPSERERSGLFTGSNLAIFAAIILVIAAVVLVSRGSNRVGGFGATADKPQQHRHSQGDHGPGRTWDAPHPLYASSEPEVASPHDEGDAYRSAKIRTLEVELHELMVSTLDQVKDRGWDVSLVCPTVHISGDPIRIQRAVLAFLGNAYLAGAQRVGIVIDDTEDGVRLSIGHDAPFEDADAEDVTSRLVGQLGQAVGNEDLDWSLIGDEDVYLATVSLGHALPLKLEPVESGA